MSRLDPLPDTMQNCPTREELVRLLHGELEISGDLEAHLETCVSCQKSLDQLSHDSMPVPRGPAPGWVPSLRLLQRLQAPSQTETPRAAVDSHAEITNLPAMAGYRVIGVLGQGGMGVVYEGIQEKLGRIVALKTLRADKVNDELRARLRREAAAIARLNHPNIVQIYEVGEWQAPTGGPPLPYLSMERVFGKSLGQWLGGQPQAPELAAEVTEILARAIHAAHEAGIVHRDLKPSNVLIQTGQPDAMASSESTDNLRALHTVADDAKPARLGPQVVLKITDFGLAKDVEAGASLTDTGQVVGTPNYMAPEQVRARAEEIGPATDIYALGAILYEMLTSRPPFVGKTPMEILMQAISADPLAPRQLLPALPRDLETICMKCLEKDPRQRYANALQLAEDLQRFERNEPILARPPSLAGKVVKWAQRKPAVASLTAALLVTLMCLLGFAGWSYIEINQALDDKGQALEQKVQALGEKDKALNMVEDALKEEQRLRGLAEAESYRALFSETSLLNNVRRLGWRGQAQANLARLARTEIPGRNLWDLRTEAVACLLGPDLTEIAYLHSNANSLDFSPDGKILAVADFTGSVSLWDIAGKKRIHQLKQRGGSLRTVVVRFRPQDTLLAYTTREGVEFFDWTRPERKEPMISVQPGPPGNLAFDHQGAYLAVNGSDGRASVHDLSTQALKYSTNSSSKNLHLVLYGDQLVTVTATNIPQVQNWTNRSKPTFLNTLRGGITDLAFSPDGRLLATGNSADSSILLWNLQPAYRQYKLLQGHTSRIRSMAFSPQGQLLASVAEDQTLRLWHAYSGQPYLSTAPGLAPLQSVAFSPDGQLLAVGGTGVKLYRVTYPFNATPTLVDTGFPKSLLMGGDLHPRRPIVAVPSGSQLVLWDLEKAAELRRWNGFPPDTQGTPRIVPCVFSPDGQTLAAGRTVAAPGPGSICLWDVETGRLNKVLTGLRATVKTLAFDATGQRLVSVSQNGETALWDVAAGNVLGRWDSENPGVRAFPLLAPDQVLLAQGPNRVALADAKAGIISTMRTPATILDVMFSPDRRSLWLNCADDRVRRLTISDWTLAELPAALTGHHLLALTPEGNILATQNKQQVVLWDTMVWKPLCNLPREEANIAHAVFGHGGARLVVFTTTGRVSVYHLPTIRQHLADLGLDW